MARGEGYEIEQLKERRINSHRKHFGECSGKGEEGGGRGNSDDKW